MSDHQKRPQVVIVGAGFGGMNAARAFHTALVDVILIDQNNYHLFQPLLYQVATAGLSPSEIAYPVRAIFRGQKNLTFRMAKMTGLDAGERILHTSTGDISYDYLILAPGGETNFFGLDSVFEHGIGLKDLDDAVTIRNHVIKMFEMAAQEVDPRVCEALRTFVIVGGGPTGVECAGAISELIRLVLVKDYPELSFEDVRVIILEMTENMLPGFPEDLSQKAIDTLRKKHVEVRLNAAVDEYDGEVVQLKDGETIRAYTLIWAAGVRAISLLDTIGLRQAKQGRIVVGPTLQTVDHPEIFVIGDAAFLDDSGGRGLPMVAPVAIQQAKVASRNVEHLIKGEPLEEFVYKDPGSLATIGRNAAVARVKGFKFHGFIAWVVWLVVHLIWLIGFRNRLLVLINWAEDYIFYERAVRIITPESMQKPEERLTWVVEDVKFESK